MSEACGDNRFEIISKAKKDILESTNIGTSPDEMKVLDSFLFRCWQMGWLNKYDNIVKAETVKNGRWIYWDGWCGNHDMRIDAICSECGYIHPTVRWQQGDPRGKAAYEAVLNKLSDECPNCGAKMSKAELEG